MHHCIAKAILSASPSVTSDYVLVTLIIYLFDDFGDFYCVTYMGEICVFDVDGPSVPQPIVKSSTLWLEDYWPILCRHSIQSSRNIS
ncbi:hypothetical protein H5410_043932 [Solanum commersonii]|uniref:Uncharacterized protein n=1 Tax=Solanum commersonii TaxID=4109 RepID=A0A9J5Y0A9_SOLCO|nr:hypothetical protein H5410_043932 [Solanum commersonii]